MRTREANQSERGFGNAVAMAKDLVNREEQKINTHRYSGVPKVPPRRKVKFSGIGSDIAITLVQFDPTLFVKSKRLNKQWREEILQCVDDYCNQIENKFVATFFEHIFFKKAYSWTKPISFCGKKGLRLDRVFECEIVTNNKFFELL